MSVIHIYIAHTYCTYVSSIVQHMRLIFIYTYLLYSCCFFFYCTTYTAYIHSYSDCQIPPVLGPGNDNSNVTFTSNIQQKEHAIFFSFRRIQTTSTIGYAIQIFPQIYRFPLTRDCVYV